MLWIRLGLSELLKYKGYSLFFILNLALGLSGFIAIHSFGKSIDRHFDENLKEILTADLVISSNKPLHPDDITLIEKTLGPDKTQAHLISFYSMVKAGKTAKLTRIMAVDNAYPLYGSFSLKNNTLISDIQNYPGLFMTYDTAYALGLQTDNIKRPIKIGNKFFFLQDIFISDPDKSLTSVELAPKIYMGMDQVKETGLIQFGSRVRISHFYRFHTNIDMVLLTNKLRTAFHKAYNGEPPLRVYNSQDVNKRLDRLSGYFTGYMGLVSVVTLFLAGIATAYLFRGYLNLKQYEIAVLMSIGAKQKNIWFYITFQLIVLGTCASILAIVFSLILIPVFPVIFQGLIPAHIILSKDPATLILGLGLGMVGSIIFCLPVFIRIFAIQPLVLLKGAVQTSEPNFIISFRLVLSMLPGLISFVLISFYAAGSIKNGMIFVAGFILVLGALTMIGRILLSLCNYLSNTQNPVVKIAFRNLFRNRWASLSAFVTIAMGVFLISLIPQVQNGLQNEIIKPDGLKIPIFFLVDIQTEQKDFLIDFLKTRDAELTNLSPMVRGRILTKNGAPFQGDSKLLRGRGRRLEFNFSYREMLDVSETIVQGQPLSKAFWNYEASETFEISVEESFAGEYQIQLNDMLGFDIQGIPFKGQVKNFRKVRWNSFQPNFYLLFQNGVLNNAPKTYLASVSQVPIENRQDLKNSIVDTFPNVSVLDVTQMAGTLLDISNKLSLSIRFMAWLAIAAGLISIFSIARQEAWKNENQINLLKVLGSDFQGIRAITLLEFGFVGFTAAFFAIILSYGFSWAISWYFFDNLWQINFSISFSILLLTTCICMGTALTASKKVMNSKPVTLLANRQI